LDSRTYRKLADIIGEQKVKLDEPMKNHTSFKIGGPCDCLLLPNSTEELINVLRFLKSEEKSIFIIGNGSNLLVRDNGIRGFVIKTDNIIENCIENNVVTASSGILLSRLSKICCGEELEGFEFASGIPGTLGGAVFMNAGAYDGEMSHVVVETSYITPDGEIKKVCGEEHEFGYRHSVFHDNGGVILSSKIKLKKGDKEKIMLRMKELNEKRKEKQPLEMPSAGSTFKRPTGYFAGKLIMDCGLKGKSIGGAMVSDKHAGFIVNTGNATAKDVQDLIEFVKNEVYKVFEVELIPEIKIVGE
jgi:UDP-N-acetylmuramate dehydrogenase